MPSNLQYLLKLIASAIEIHSSETGYMSNAGKDLEELVRARVFSSVILPDKTVKFKNRKLRINSRSNKLEIANINDSDYMLLTSLTDISMEHITRSNEIGIDGVVFEIENNKVIMHCWQCKIGYLQCTCILQ